MDVLVGVLGLLLAVALLVEVAARTGVPYPALLVVGGIGLALVPGLPAFSLEPDLVLLVFLPPLLFAAAFEMPLRDLRKNVWPLGRLAIGLVLVTTVVVAIVAHAAIPDLSWAAALTLGAIVSPTDALAATAVFRRLKVPRRIVVLVEGESLLNDATALIAYRVAVVAALGGAVAADQTFGAFVMAVIGGIAIGAGVGFVTGQILRRIDDPPVEVAISLVIPYAAYLPADQLGYSAVLAAVVAGLVVSRGSARISSPESRTLGLGTWQMITFLLNGFAFILIGLELPDIVRGLAPRTPAEVIGLGLVISAAVIVTRFVWVFGSSLLPGSPRRELAKSDSKLATRATFIVSWSGLRGVVSLAAALALPVEFPERSLIIVLTFAVIVVTLVGQGISLPFLVRRTGLEGFEIERDEETIARMAAYDAGYAELERIRPDWPTHGPLFERLESGLRDRSQHLATGDVDETAERRQERIEHEAIQRAMIGAERSAIISLRDTGEINDQVLRTIERELDLEELRLEG